MPRRKPKPGKKNRFDQKKEVRALARERVGPVKAGKVIVPRTARKKPKHKKALEENEGA
jgi:hypothetical protein